MTALLLVVTFASIAVAAAMATVAWRLAREERRRSVARVAALAAEVERDAPSDLPLRSAPETAPLLTAPVEIGGRSRIAAVIAGGVFIVGSGAALAVVMSGSPMSSRGQPSVPESASRAVDAVRRPALPLELTALGHERDGDRMTVRGVIRNPAEAAEIDNLAAVVFLFDADGAFTASTRAGVDRTALPGGAESTFRVIIPAAGNVARYRVSFRTDRTVIPHVDRRRAQAQDQR